MVDVETPLGEQRLDVPVGQREPQTAAHPPGRPPSAEPGPDELRHRRDWTKAVARPLIRRRADAGRAGNLTKYWEKATNTCVVDSRDT